MSEQAREHFRIFYPSGPNPVFACEFGHFAILDVSEGGFRFELPRKLKFYFFEYDTVEGHLVFPDKRGIFPVKGQVVRTTDFKIAVKLHQHTYIPLPHIMEEQRILIRSGKLRSA